MSCPCNQAHKIIKHLRGTCPWLIKFSTNNNAPFFWVAKWNFYDFDHLSSGVLLTKIVTPTAKTSTVLKNISTLSAQTSNNTQKAASLSEPLIIAFIHIMILDGINLDSITLCSLPVPVVALM